MGVRRVFLLEQVFGQRNRGSRSHLPSESVWEGVQTSGDSLVQDIFPSDFLSEAFPTPLNRPAFGKKGKGRFTMLMVSSAHVRLQPPDTKPEEPRQIPRQTMLFPFRPASLLAWPSPSRDMGLCEGGASFLGLTWDGWALGPWMLLSCPCILWVLLRTGILASSPRA